MPFRVAVFLLAFGMAVLAAAYPGGSRAEESFQSATVCSQCHPEIYRTWRFSKHASAFTSPLFQISLDRIRRTDPGQALPCEHCHNPIGFFLEPGDPKAAVFAQEGVTCDFCHSVEFVIQGAGFPRYLVTPGIKFGPYPTAGRSSGAAHETKFAPLHILSVFCAGCHEYRNGNGISVLSTYSEWEESFYRGKSVHCQFCHLPELFDARFIDPERKRGSVNHDMVGGHSPELLARAIPVRATLTANDTEACLTVHVKNDFVGHKAPSGIPIHRLRLETTLYDEDRCVLGRGEEIFERVLGDGAGNPVRVPERIFPDAKEVLKDNRIAPKETREVVHRFPLREKKPKTAEVALLYEIFLSDTGAGLQSSSLPVLRVVVPVTARIAWPYVAILVLGGIGLLLAAGFLLRRGGR